MTDRFLARRPLPEVVCEAVAQGVDWVQIREKDLSGKPLLELSRRVAHAAHSGALVRRKAGEEAHVRVVVNRRSDVALALRPGAPGPREEQVDGVHLGFDGVSPREARELLGADAWIGASCHAPEEVLAAQQGAASYAHLAPIFSPISKAAQRPSLGLAALAAAARGELLVLAQGGIDEQNAGEIVSAGAGGVAVTGAILLAADPGRAAGALRQALDTGWAG